MDVIINESKATSGVNIGADIASKNLVIAKRWPISSWRLTPDSDNILLWLARYTIETNHPRAIVTLGAKRRNDVLCFNLSDSIQKCLTTLHTEGFQSAPVLDDNGQYVGFIDLMDLLIHMLKTFGLYRGEMNFVSESTEDRVQWW